MSNQPSFFRVREFFVRLGLVAAALALAVAVSEVIAWTNPSAAPPSGGGALTSEANSPAGSIYIQSDGDVGIGTASPAQKLSVNGIIESLANGFKFPDGTTQTTAAITSAPSFSVYKTSNQTIANNTDTLVTWDSEEFDTNNNFASNRFTPTVAGKYLLTAGLEALPSTSVNQVFARIHKNGSGIRRMSVDLGGSGRIGFSISAIVNANGSSDYFEIYTYQNSGSNLTLEGNSVITWFAGARISN